MRLTITTDSDDIYSLDVSEDMELENIKALCEFETGIATSNFHLFFNTVVMTDGKKSLKNYGISDGDVLLLRRMPGGRGQGSQSGARGQGMPRIDFGSIQMPGVSGSSSSGGAAATSGAPSGGLQGSDDPAVLRDLLLNSPHDLALVKERNPPLAEALLSGDLSKFSAVLKKQQEERAEKERQRISLLNADQFDPAIQQQIQEEIRLKNVESNMEAAMEFAPESFGQVLMLYIDCKVNGHPVKAFVDSGAQMTIMSQKCAERCGIMRLVDTRWAGIAKGVGTQKIIGRVHLCPVLIEKDHLPTSFSILEEQPMDMLLGLDMLKRHQCMLDLRNNKLIIGTTGTETTFLGEGDVPEHARLNRTPNDMEVGMDEDRQLAEALARSANETASPSTSSKPSTSSSSSATSSTPSASRASIAFPEVDIVKLISQGFSREAAVEALTKTQGNVDQALIRLLAKTFTKP